MDDNLPFVSCLTVFQSGFITLSRTYVLWFWQEGPGGAARAGTVRVSREGGWEAYVTHLRWSAEILCLSFQWFFDYIVLHDVMLIVKCHCPASFIGFSWQGRTDSSPAGQSVGQAFLTFHTWFDYFCPKWTTYYPGLKNMIRKHLAIVLPQQRASFHISPSKKKLQESQTKKS